MGRKARIWYEGAMYHIINRGNSRQNIFIDPADRVVFLDKLRGLVMEHGLRVHAYCLMTNHYHLVIETGKRHIGDTMRSLNTYYSKQYHIKYGTSGHLFQGRYRSVLVEKDAYLLELSRYVHLNPVGASLVKLPEHYPWSSMKVYIGEGSGSSLVYRDTVLGYFNQDSRAAQESYRRFVHAKLADNSGSLEKLVTYDDILGTESFVSEIRALYSV
ncbi:MAG TPA: hypothetical protein GX016_00770 [Firmicutes bacterium]|nr:hypothetical protein [Bacillota bacterium]